MNISVILPNYNGANLLQDNLPSLINALNNTSLEYEIIVVDDFSTDDSVKFLNENYPEIKVIKHKENKGFSAACNTGIFKANSEILCITNTDVFFDKDFFKYSITHFENKNTGAVVGVIKNYIDNRDNITHIDTYIIPYFKHGFFRYKNADFAENEKDAKTVLANLGCCFLARKSVLEKLKGFNEIYSPYIWEDTDLGYRMYNSGFKIIFEPQAIAYHKTSSTLKKIKKTKIKIISTRNKFLFFWLNIKSKKEWCFHILFILFSLLFRWLIFDWIYYFGLYNALKSYKYSNKIANQL